MCASCPKDELIDYDQTAADLRKIDQRNVDQIWAFAKEWHPIGEPFAAWDRIAAGDYSGAAWGVATLGAGKLFRVADKGIGAGFDFVRRAFCCFASGTLVVTKDGLRPIEEIKVGDLVLSRDDTTGATAYKPVKALLPKHERAIWVVTLSVPNVRAGQTPKQIEYKTTDDHPWRLATGIWAETAQLGRGMQVVRADGVPAEVVSVFETGKTGAVYNLEVADFHTYFVGEERVWVHNACGPATRFLDGVTVTDKFTGRTQGNCRSRPNA